MFAELLLFAACGLLGIRLQRTPRGERLRERIWRINYVVLIPVAATYAFLSIELDRTLFAIIACALVAWWLTVLAAGGYARVVAPTRPLRGALWLAGAFPNTGFLGFPLTYLAFGDSGLQLAVIYDQVSLVIPAIVVATVLASRHTESDAVPRRSVWRELAASPPLWTVATLVLLRATLLPAPLDLDRFGAIVGVGAGAVGFLLFGLSVPLHGFAHDRAEVSRTIGAMFIRIALAPVLVWCVAHIAGVDVPRSLYLIAAMPTAFHALIVARRYELEAAVVRLAVVGTSGVMIVVSLAIAFGSG